MKQEGGKQKRSVLWWFAFITLLVIFLASLIGLGITVFGYMQSRGLYGGVSDDAFAVEDDPEHLRLEEIHLNWDELRAQNPDIVAWVYIPDTPVDYPIVQGSDNSKYLYTDFYGGQGSTVRPGTPFLDAGNSPNLSDQNNIMYGHHLNDGTMFAFIDELVNDTTFNEHRTVYLFTPERNYRLTTFSIVIVAENDPLAQTTFASDQDFASYLQDKRTRSEVSPQLDDFNAAEIEQCFVFVTCDYSAYDMRAALFASVAESAVPD